MSTGKECFQVSYVSQDKFLFNISLMENIRIGKPDASDEEVLEAAKKAQCMEFINQMPRGFETPAGDCGNQLSGGEKQRITLARAILKDAPIVVLDEATAFADPENEEKMEEVIARQTADYNCFCFFGVGSNISKDANRILLFYTKQILS